MVLGSAGWGQEVGMKEVKAASGRSVAVEQVNEVGGGLIME